MNVVAMWFHAGAGAFAQSILLNRGDVGAEGRTPEDEARDCVGLNREQGGWKVSTVEACDF